jgi:hypothetical protein
METTGNPKSRNYPKNTGVRTLIPSSITFMLAGWGPWLRRTIRWSTFMLAGWEPWLRRTIRWSTRRPAYSPCSSPQSTPSSPKQYILTKNVLPSDWLSLYITFTLLLNQELVVEGNLIQLCILRYAFQHKISHNGVHHFVSIYCTYCEMMVLTYCTTTRKSTTHVHTHAYTHIHTH